MLTVKTKKGNSGRSDSFVKSFENLTEQTVSFGHYESQGKHYSDMSYPELMKGWASGWDGTKFGGIVKNPKAIAINNIRVWAKSPELRKAFHEWSKKAGRKRTSNPTSPNKLLNDFGEYLRENYRDLFGEVSAPHMPYVEASDNGTPLQETGDLKSKVAYKTSTGKRVTSK